MEQYSTVMAMIASNRLLVIDLWELDIMPAEKSMLPRSEMILLKAGMLLAGMELQEEILLKK